MDDVSHALYSVDTPPKWMTEGDKEALFRAGVKYMDITDYPNPPVSLQSAWTPCKLAFS